MADAFSAGLRLHSRPDVPSQHSPDPIPTVNQHRAWGPPGEDAFIWPPWMTSDGAYIGRVSRRSIQSNSCSSPTVLLPVKTLYIRGDRDMRRRAMGLEDRGKDRKQVVGHGADAEYKWFLRVRTAVHGKGCNVQTTTVCRRRRSE